MFYVSDFIFYGTAQNWADTSQKLEMSARRVHDEKAPHD
jgi:hypothetical protein